MWLAIRKYMCIYLYTITQCAFYLLLYKIIHKSNDIYLDTAYTLVVLYCKSIYWNNL